MYRMHRVFCATAWELEGERLAFDNALGHINETEAMPKGLLFVPVSLTNIRDKRPYQFLLEENLRDSRYYILALSDGWGPPERNFQRDYQLAREHCANPALPMRDVALLVRSPASPSPFAAELALAGYPAVAFADVEDFVRVVRARLSGWLSAELPSEPAQTSVAP
jgi:hypothetical protein